MKKFLAALLAVVMVVSVASFAFAADQIDCYSMESFKSGKRTGVKVDADLKKGDIVSFYVYIPLLEGSDADYDSIKVYVRGAGSDTSKADYLDAEGNPTGAQCYSTWVSDEKGPQWSNSDGWFYIEAKLTADGVHQFTVLTYDEHEDCPARATAQCKVQDEYAEDSPECDAYVDNYKVSADCKIAGLKVNGVAVDSSKVTLYESNTVATKTSIEAPVADPVVDTEDVTEGTEETGVVSVAVVAVAAVVGGAVVLKKREF